MNKDKDLYYLMQKYGKLTSCDIDNPSSVDILFKEELELLDL